MLGGPKPGYRFAHPGYAFPSGVARVSVSDMRVMVGGAEPGYHDLDALWQRRYWEHTVRDEQDFVRHVDYVHYNPVKHRVVTRVRDWPHSSFHLYVRRGLLPQDWARDVN